MANEQVNPLNSEVRKVIAKYTRQGKKDLEASITEISVRQTVEVLHRLCGFVDCAMQDAQEAIDTADDHKGKFTAEKKGQVQMAKKVRERLDMQLNAFEG